MSDKIFNEVYTVDYLGNVVEGEIIRYLNLPSKRLKEAAASSIKERSSRMVWMRCGKTFS